MQALAELNAYNRSGASVQASLREADLTKRLTCHLQDQLGSNVQLPQPLTVAAVLRRQAPTVDTEQRIPLTW